VNVGSYFGCVRDPMASEVYHFYWKTGERTPTNTPHSPPQNSGRVAASCYAFRWNVLQTPHCKRAWDFSDKNRWRFGIPQDKPPDELEVQRCTDTELVPRAKKILITCWRQADPDSRLTQPWKYAERCARMEDYMRCAFCGQSIATRLDAWRTASAKLYCSEFCAEIESQIETVECSGRARVEQGAPANSLTPPRPFSLR
jgi:hypothetical protein